MTIIEDVRSLRASIQEVSTLVEANRATIARHDEQISGERGLSAAINVLAEEVRSLRRALWTVGGGIVIAAVGFGFSVLQLVH